jgi:3-dehydroquinate dehydratase
MAKVDEQLVQTVREIQQDMQTVQHELGAIALMENRKQELLTIFKELDSKLQATRKEISDEMGEGTLDLATGEFTPAEAVSAE